MFVLKEVLDALAELHRQSGDLAHGALAPERIVLADGKSAHRGLRARARYRAAALTRPSGTGKSCGSRCRRRPAALASIARVDVAQAA